MSCALAEKNYNYVYLTESTRIKEPTSHSWGMESDLVAEFIAQTGADRSVAFNILKGQGWNLNSALKAYYFLVGSDSSGVPETRTSNTRSLVEGTYTASIVPISHPEEGVQNSKPNEDSQSIASLSSVRPVLKKSQAFDFADVKKLARGISRATDNVNLVSKARDEFALDFTDGTVCHVNQYFIETPVYTFTLPDLTIYSEDFRGFLEKDLIEISTLVSLEQAGRLNWWADTGACQRLWPLATTGDGNCLLHAASLGMWGFHDRLLTLRKALYAFMTSSECKDALWRRWRWQQTQLNTQAGFVYSEEEWVKEWENIVNMASTTPRRSTSRRRSMILDMPRSGDDVSENATYESLEEIHVLALAHVLRRPIVVIADLILKDVNGDALAPIPFGGIYLPLECSPSECHCSPLVLTYDAAHFSALVVMEKETFADKTPQPPAVIPLTDSEHELLPIQFSVDPGELFVWGQDEDNPHIVQKLTLAEKEKLGLLKEYLDVVQVPLPCSNVEENGDLDGEFDSLPYTNDEEDIEKRYSEVDVDNEENLVGLSESGIFNNKSKAAKQLQSVAKQFGSIGKSMSKKLKKNFGSITKITRSNSLKKKYSHQSSPVRQTTKTAVVSSSQDYILAAVLHTEKRHEYQEEMIRNYLQSARARFEKDKELKQKQAEERKMKDEQRLKDVAEIEGPSKCINPGCNMYGTAMTSYMCSSCYEKQKEHEQELSKNPMKINSPLMNRSYDTTARYGMGKSRFYADADTNSHDVVSKLPLSRAGSNVDQTLYLSKSTFYKDTYPAGATGIQSYNLGRQDPIISHSTLSAGKGVGSRIPSYNLAKQNESTVKYSDRLTPQQSDACGKTLSRTSSSQAILEEAFGNSSEISKLQTRFHNNACASGSTLRNTIVSTLTSQLSNEMPDVSVNERVKSSDYADSVVSSRISGGIKLPVSGAQQCRTANCLFFGSADTDFYCSKCFKEMKGGGYSSAKNMTVQQVRL